MYSWNPGGRIKEEFISPYSLSNRNESGISLIILFFRRFLVHFLRYLF